MPAMQDIPLNRAVFGTVYLCRQEFPGAVHPRGRGDPGRIKIEGNGDLIGSPVGGIQ